MHEKVFDFVCEFCPYKTATEQGIIDHVEAVHKTDGKFVASQDDGNKSGVPRMWWPGNPDAVPKNVAANVANAAKEFSSNNSPEKKTVEQLPPLLALKRNPGDRGKDEEETQNHIKSAPEEPSEQDMYPVPLDFKREYDAEELMEYPGTQFNGTKISWLWGKWFEFWLEVSFTKKIEKKDKTESKRNLKQFSSNTPSK